MKNWKNAEIIALDIEDTASGLTSLYHENFSNLATTAATWFCDEPENNTTTTNIQVVDQPGDPEPGTTTTHDIVNHRS